MYGNGCIRTRFYGFGVQIFCDGLDYWKYKDNVLCELLTGEAVIVDDSKRVD